MKTHPECLPCLLRQALQVAKLTKCTEKQQLQIMQAVAEMIAKLDLTKSPPANAGPIYKKIAELTGCDDPYLEKKTASNEQALEIIPALQQEIKGTEHEFLSVVRFAIAGNIIDYGAFESYDFEAALSRSRSAPLAVDHFAQFSEAVNRLEKGNTVLYLTDNCGEIVYDSLLIEWLYRKGVDITIAVKGGPIINDALVADALAAGLDKYGTIITNGCRIPGTEVAECSQAFQKIYHSADLVISKGQGNFESLSEADREIFFLLTVKCPVAAAHMRAKSGVSPEMLIGKGEMAVYHGVKKK